MWKMKENIIALVWAVILTAVVVVIINSNSGVFEADVLQWSSGHITKNSNWDDIEAMSDMELLVDNGNIFLKSNRDFTSISNLTLEISFDSSKITLDRDNIDTDYDMILTKEDSDDSVDMLLQNIGDIKKWDTIFSIKNMTKKDLEFINIWQVLLSDLEWGSISLSISK